MSDRRTEVGGWQAIWRIDRHRIRMLLVRNTSGSRPLLSAPVAATAPDLAQMRERFPDLSPLWDAIRHEYWTEIIATQQGSSNRADGRRVR
ncbi:hypothetical protein [Nocardia wallacei]|uniref:hypothetical protein n=1 Tax=Nocardia wallacei TaxID=480035 RepID=UPI001657365A|nr:hypothetical protein [Nocardia wallacei]